MKKIILLLIYMVAAGQVAVTQSLPGPIPTCIPGAYAYATGYIRDAGTGAGIRNASITVVVPAHYPQPNKTQTVTSDDTGYYTFPVTLYAVPLHYTLNIYFDAGVLSVDTNRGSRRKR